MMNMEENCNIFNQDFNYQDEAKNDIGKLNQSFKAELSDLKNSLLLVLDVQESFFGEHINQIDLRLENRNIIKTNICKLIQEFRIAKLPIITTKHLCTKSGMGGFLSKEDNGRDLCEDIESLLEKKEIYDKTEYSAYQNEKIRNKLTMVNPENVFLAGGSTEICILQTANDLSNNGKKVFTVADCVASSSKAMNLQILNLLNMRQYNQQTVSLNQIQKSLIL
jgi:nicotinamidase-related amidase